MRPYPLYLEIMLKISRIFACLFPYKQLRENVRNYPFVLTHRICQLTNSKDSINADLFISLGDACKPALHLRNYGLRKLSCPLDWMMCYGLDEAYRCFEVGFADFFEKCYEDSQKNNDTNAKERRIISASNAGMISIHAFPKSISLENHLPIFRDKMQKRFGRLKSKILDSNCIAFLCARNTHSIENLADFGKKFITLCDTWQNLAVKSSDTNERERERESKIRVVIINVRHSDGFSKMHIKKQVHKINERVCVVDFACNDTSINSKKYFLGNTRAWQKIMCQLKLNT